MILYTFHFNPSMSVLTQNQEDTTHFVWYNQRDTKQLLGMHLACTNSYINMIKALGFFLA